MKDLKFKIKSYTWGFITASFLSSMIIYGGTLVEGIYQFAGGEVISATEMNHNFRQLRGDVLVEATNDTAISLQINSPTQECENAVQECSSGYVSFGNETIGTFDTRTDPSASVLHSSTSGADMSFITIPADGFYEITLISPFDSLTISAPDEFYESTKIEANFAVIKFDPSVAARGTVTPNNSAMDTPRIDGVEVNAPLQSRTSVTKGDSVGDGLEDFVTENIENGVKKELYLEAGDGIAVFYWIFFDNFYTPVGTDNIQYGIGSVKIKVKQVLD